MTSIDFAKGLTMDVYANPKYRGCAAGGISETVEQVTVVGVVDESLMFTGNRYSVQPLPEGSRPFEANDQRPAVLLVKRQIGGPVWSVVPLDAYTAEGTTQHWYSAGGSYVATCDSRISEITKGFYGAFNLHDRKEW